MSLVGLNVCSLISANIVDAVTTKTSIHRKLLTVVLTDVVMFVSPVVFIETKFSVFCTNTRTPVVVCVVVKIRRRKS